MNRVNIYFHLLPTDLKIELALYLPLEMVKSNCKVFDSWTSICSNVIYLRKYIAYTYNIPMEEVLKIPTAFFIEYSNSSTIEAEVDATIKYDFEPLFKYYLNETQYVDILKESYQEAKYAWLIYIIHYSIKYKAYKIIYYLMEKYSRKLNMWEKNRIISIVVHHGDTTIFEYFTRDLGWVID